MQSKNLQMIVELRHILHRKAELSLHTAEYDFNDRILETAVDLFAGLAVD